MKRIITTLIVFVWLGSNAQEYSIVSPALQGLIKAHHVYGEHISESNAWKYGPLSADIHPQDSKLNVLIKGKESLAAELEKAGVSSFNQIGNVYSLHISVAELAVISKLSGIERIEESPRGNTKLKNARRNTKVDMVHLGSGLNSPYHGSGVVVGVIDFGLDFSHPMFYTSDGSSTRISRVWLTDNNTGTPPSGFTYGTELTTLAELQAEGASNYFESHGSHVAGIAAGTAYLKPDLKGVADQSEIVFVESGNSVADELTYIFNYARSVSKPAVVNMSLGSHKGPHDGSSLLDLAIDNLAKSGQIIVGAAGNEGDKALHLKHTFSGDTISTIPELEGENTTVDIWGEKNKHFSLNLVLYDLVNDAIVYETGYWSTTINTSLDSTFNLGSDYLSLSYGGELSSLNQKSHAQIAIESTTQDYAVYFEMTSPSGVVHAWNDGTGGGAPFIDDVGSGPLTGFVKGDNESTMGEIGATAKNIISVGAYTSTTTFTSLVNSTVTNTTEADGAIADFSSRGPTVDGRVVPSITAPGNYVISSLNSYNIGSTPGGDEDDRITDSTMIGTDAYYYGAYEGTSMATPMVVGIIALLLEKYPTLTPAQIKTLLKEQSIKDSHTGTIPAAGSNTWGYGKIDALAMLVKLEGGAPVDPVVIEEIVSENGIRIYPVPTSHLLHVEGQTKFENIEVISIDGKVNEVPTVLISDQKAELDISALSEGMYLLRVRTHNENQVFRVLKR